MKHTRYGISAFELSDYSMITPPIATALRARGLHNRQLSEESVRIAAADLRAGRWVALAARPIVLDLHDRLVEGNHRCEAVIRTGISMSALVVTGAIDDRFYEAQDRARSHTSADWISKVLDANGEKPTNLQHVATIARLALTFEHGMCCGSVTEMKSAMARLNTYRGRRILATLVAPRYQLYEEAVRASRRWMTARTEVGFPLASTCAAACAAYSNGKWDERIEAVLGRAFSMVGLMEGSIEHLLSRRLSGREPHTVEDKFDVAAAVTRALLSINGPQRALKQLKGTIEDDFPIVPGKTSPLEQMATKEAP